MAIIRSKHEAKHQPSEDQRDCNNGCDQAQHVSRRPPHVGLTQVYTMHEQHRNGQATPHCDVQPALFADVNNSQ